MIKQKTDERNRRWPFLRLSTFMQEVVVLSLWIWSWDPSNPSFVGINAAYAIFWYERLHKVRISDNYFPLTIYITFSSSNK